MYMPAPQELHWFFCLILLLTIYDVGGRSSVVRESEFKSEESRFDPVAGQGEGQFSVPESTLVQTSL